MKTNNLVILMLLCIHGGILLYFITITDSLLMQLSWLGVLILTGMAAWPLVKKKDSL